MKGSDPHTTICNTKKVQDFDMDADCEKRCLLLINVPSHEPITSLLKSSWN